MIPLCLDQGVGLIPYSPLGGGLLAGNRKAGTVRSKGERASARFRRPEDDAVVDAVAQAAEARGMGPARVALAWVLSRPGVAAPIVGVTKVEQLEDALHATELALTAEETAALEAAYSPQAALPVFR